MLAKRGQPRLASCVFYDQTDEDIQHILIDYVFAREFWYKILEPVGLAASTPGQDDQVFAEWWRKARKRANKRKRKVLNSLIILGAWSLWKHRNRCVFEGGGATCIQVIMQEFNNEKQLWHLAGAKSLQKLGPGEAPN
ncbi:hypothetical protein PR202_gb29423 [Eleusine coracana subsp. coracana]|uniref:Uncharacterized protein n=1 Tax=Eleusine coracana subsp. coracana TaxID=191504 RepID=A0AAV5FZL4_ELECO|nr:hypothetical protein PR202_gb29423 [Eleusine coracana subsp. coracana]